MISLMLLTTGEFVLRYLVLNNDLHAAKLSLYVQAHFSKAPSYGLSGHAAPGTLRNAHCMLG